MPGRSRILLHATAVVLDAACAPFGAAPGAAVLLTGASGAGKSDVALRLMAMGARLLADDQTALFAVDGRLFADCVPELAGKMEIRGVGVVAFERAGPAPVCLAVALDPGAEIPRLPEPRSLRLPPGLADCAAPPLIVLNPFEAGTPAKIAAAASALARGAFVAGAGPASPLS